MGSTEPATEPATASTSSVLAAWAYTTSTADSVAISAPTERHSSEATAISQTSVSALTSCGTFTTAITTDATLVASVASAVHLHWLRLLSGPRASLGNRPFATKLAHGAFAQNRTLAGQSIHRSRM